MNGSLTFSISFDVLLEKRWRVARERARAGEVWQPGREKTKLKRWRRMLKKFWRRSDHHGEMTYNINFAGKQIHQKKSFHRLLLQPKYQQVPEQSTEASRTDEASFIHILSCVNFIFDQKKFCLFFFLALDCQNCLYERMGIRNEQRKTSLIFRKRRRTVMLQGTGSTRSSLWRRSTIIPGWK